MLAWTCDFSPRRGMRGGGVATIGCKIRDRCLVCVVLHLPSASERFVRGNWVPGGNFRAALLSKRR